MRKRERSEFRGVDAVYDNYARAVVSQSFTGSIEVGIVDEGGLSATEPATHE